MVFSIFTELCSPLSNHRIFHLPPKETLHLLAATPPFLLTLCPVSWQPLLYSVSVGLPILDVSYKGNHICMILCDWLLSLQGCPTHGMRAACSLGWLWMQPSTKSYIYLKHCETFLWLRVAMYLMCGLEMPKVWYPCLSIMFPRFIHIIASISTSFISMTTEYFIQWI